MNKLSELKDGSAFFYNDLALGCVVAAVKVKKTEDSDMLIGEFDIMTGLGPGKLLSNTEVYPTQEMAKKDLRKFIQGKVTGLKNKIQDLEEQLRIYEDALVKVDNNESD